ncbi:leucyl aminopeptidase family protein [Roseomonas stagni]|uniref:Leucyl aminopeptidase family protein n=1 Tax=Falsiroseomonas algicola TaxID=2716930 RepID=A0A6M1LM94_9PROT|nr:leucyl aminopeptidase family protein [Falsiroseomonas algicola]NGM21481.1 leucyl aminopeptidase family protein [Falsiroseomonas algicola]
MLDCLIPASLAGTDAAALPLHLVTKAGLPALLDRLAPGQAAFLRASGFAAKANEVRLLPGGTGIEGAVAGLGEEPSSPWSYGGLPMALPEGTDWRLEGEADAPAALLGWCLGAYRYSRFKTPPRQPARLMQPPGTDTALAEARAICRGRDLINTPAGHLGPEELAEAVRALAADYGASCEVIEGQALAEGFPAVAVVGQGSPRAPRVAVLRWQGPGAGADAPLLALCGKGVCFDTGGLDLKPAAAMLRMKKDMGGAATMIAVAEMLMAAATPIRLLLLVGAVENSVSGTAFRPMDVIATRKGLTVEIGNTDAEGRLVLCDLLAFAAEQSPALVIDAATLTGAARVALGPDLPALFSDDAEVAKTILRYGLDVQDPVWQLPLHRSYVSWLDSNIADLNNVATKPMAGAVIAALFLRRFVPDDLPWAHVDLYAYNDQTRPGRPEGGEIQAARALARAVTALLLHRDNP